MNEELTAAHKTIHWWHRKYSFESNNVELKIDWEIRETLKQADLSYWEEERPLISWWDGKAELCGGKPLVRENVDDRGKIKHDNKMSEDSP
ncbi:MAG: hypothetical protein Ta2E_13160 [Mycoplasmoidaceae bacterium]|nr:MAG: hypothetical protein Ta2E_13160 [Mycoplasmoidaceae bacterium]